MTAPNGLALIALVLAAPVYGQQSSIGPTVPSSAATPAASNAVPMTPGQAATTLIEGANEAQEQARDAVSIGTDAREVLGKKVPKPLEQFMDKADKYGGSAGAVVGAAEAYREHGAEGMAIYGAQELGERIVDNIIEKALGPAGPAWSLGRRAGEFIREIPVGGETIQGHVTNFYFNSFHGRWANEDFERNTSDEAIERHRQKLRQQRFETMSRSNEQAVANRAATAAQHSESENAAVMNQMMLQLLPAAIIASQPAIRPPLATPTVASPLPELQYRQRCMSDGRRVGTNEWGPTHCWQEPVYPGRAPTGRPPIESPPLGSTFGSPSPNVSSQPLCNGAVQGRNPNGGFC